MDAAEVKRQRIHRLYDAVRDILKDVIDPTVKPMKHPKGYYIFFSGDEDTCESFVEGKLPVSEILEDIAEIYRKHLLRDLQNAGDEYVA